MPEKDNVLPISAVEFDPQNARKRTERSSSMIKDSLQKFGPLRSLVGQKLPDGRIIVRAGNGTLEEAGQIGIDKVRVVERKPDELIVVVADDLDESQWKSYAIADNRTSDLSEWDDAVLQELAQDVNLDAWFNPEEMAGWDVEPLNEEDEDPILSIPEDQPYDNKYAVAVECDDEAHQEDVYNALIKLGYKCKVLTL